MAGLERPGIFELGDLRLHSFDDLGMAVAGIDAPQSGGAVEDLAAVMAGVMHTLGGDKQARLLLEMAVAGERHPMRFEVVRQAQIG